MTHDNPATNSTDPPSETPAPSASGVSKAPPSGKPKRSWLRRILIVVGVLVLLIGLLIALIPTILSTGAARTFAVGKINENLNGHVTIADWSLGWTGGIRLDGVKVFDESNRQILEIAHFNTQLSLIGAARGQYHLGKTVVDGLDFNAERYADGTLNFAKLAKNNATKEPQKSPSNKEPEGSQDARKPEPEKKGGQTKLPDVDGELTLVNCRGTLQTDSVDAKTQQPKSQLVKFTAIDGDIKIPGINQPISDSLKVVANTGGPQSGTVSLDGTLQIAQNNLLLDTDKMNVDQKLGISNFALASALGFLPPDLTQLEGMTDGTFTVHLAAGQPGFFEGGVTVNDVKARGPITKDDTYTAKSITLTIPKTTLDMSPGLGGPDHYHIHVGSGAGDPAINLLIINDVAGKPSQSTISLMADATPALLKNLAANKPPGGDGVVRLAVDLDVAPLAQSLPHLLNMIPDREIKAGRLQEATDIRLSTTKADLQQSLTISNVVAENKSDHKTITLQPIELMVKASDFGGGGKLPDIRDILLQLKTGTGDNGGYATADIKGKTLSEVSAVIHADLDRVQKEWSQLIDFSNLKLGGTVDVTANSTGNLIPELAKPNEQLGADAKVNLHVNNLVLNKGSGPAVEKVFDNYNMGADLAANYSFDKTGSILNISHLLIGDDATSPQTTIGIENTDNKPIQIITSADGKMQGSGSLHIIRLNLGRLQEIQKAFAAAPQPGAAKPTPEARLAGGWAAGSASFGTTDKQELKIDVDLGVSAITYVVPNAKGLNNEQVKVVLSALATQNFASIAVPSCDLTTSVMTLHATNTELRLKESTDKEAKSTPILEMVRKANVVVTIPKLLDLQQKLDAITPPSQPAKPVAGTASASVERWGPLYALADKPKTSSAATPSPTPPTKLASGGGTVTLDISRNNASQMVISPVVDFKDVALEKDGVPDPLGAIAARGLITLITVSGNAPHSMAATRPGTQPATEPSIIDQIASIQMSQLSVAGVGSGLTINGIISDLAGARNLKNVTTDLTYNSTMLWQALLPLMSREQQTKLKGSQVAGNYTHRFTINGNYPAGKEFNEAITGITADGELQLDLFNGEGITIKSFIIPIMLSQGKARIVYAGKPEKQNLAAPADFNDGKLNLAGVVVDLSDPHATITIPPGTMLLDKVGLNPVFASNLGDYINNPLWVDSDKSAGQMSIRINRCDKLPTDATLTEQVPSNQGVLDAIINVNRIQLGNATLHKIGDALAATKILGGNHLITNSLQGDVKDYHVHMEHGVTDHDMTLTLGEGNRPLHLFGNVAMQTRQMHMTMDFPFALFGVKPTKQLTAVVGDGVKLPLAGHVTQPQFNLAGAVQQNIKGFQGNPQDILKGLLGKNDKPENDASTTQPAPQKNDNPVEDILGAIGKKDKKKDKK